MDMPRIIWLYSTAEFLVKGHVPTNRICELIVLTPKQVERVKAIQQQTGTNIPIYVDSLFPGIPVFIAVTLYLDYLLFRYFQYAFHLDEFSILRKSTEEIQAMLYVLGRMLSCKFPLEMFLLPMVKWFAEQSAYRVHPHDFCVRQWLSPCPLYQFTTNNPT